MSKINYDISWEINSPSVTYGHRKSVFKFVCLELIAYIPTFRKFWGLGNKLMVKKTKQKKSTNIKYDVISFFLCQ